MMAALSSKLSILARYDRSKITPRVRTHQALVQLTNAISFLSKSTNEKKEVEKDSEGRLIVDPDVVIDPGEKHLVHKELPLPMVEEKKVLTESEIENLRNKSRLRQPDHRRLHGLMPYETPRFWTHYTVKYKRRMFGRYGEAADVNPGICWPLESELKLRQEYESVAQPFTFHEMVDKVKAKKQAEKEAIERRVKEVEEKMAASEKAKEEYLARVRLKEKDAQEALERKEKLVEEVRRHFGYKIDIRDERFQEMLERKEREQRKAKKEARKLARAQDQLRKLSEMAQKEKAEAEASSTEAETAQVDEKSKRKLKSQEKEKKEESDSDSEDEEDKQPSKKEK